MRILGIDPGLDGGLALLSPDGLLLEVMPTFGSGQREVDAAKVAELLRGWSPTHAMLEKVGSRPGQGVCSMFTFGCGVGVIKGVLGALGISFTEVTPQTWQKTVCKGLAGGDPKDVAVQRARQLWPTRDLRATQRSKVPHQGLVDAALIAEYGRLQQAWAAL